MFTGTTVVIWVFPFRPLLGVNDYERPLECYIFEKNIYFMYQFQMLTADVYFRVALMTHSTVFLWIKIPGNTLVFRNFLGVTILGPL